MTQARSWSADCGTISITKAAPGPRAARLAQGDAVQRLRDRLVAVRVAAGIQQMGVPHPSLLRHAKAHRRPETAHGQRRQAAERIAHAGLDQAVVAAIERPGGFAGRRATRPARPARAAAPRRSSRCTRRPGQNLRSACGSLRRMDSFTAAERRPTVNAARCTTDPPVTLLYCSSAACSGWAGMSKAKMGRGSGGASAASARQQQAASNSSAGQRRTRHSVRVQRAAFERQRHTPTPHARGALLPWTERHAPAAQALRPCRVRRAGSRPDAVAIGEQAM